VEGELPGDTPLPGTSLLYTAGAEANFRIASYVEHFGTKHCALNIGTAFVEDIRVHNQHFTCVNRKFDGEAASLPDRTR